MKKNLSLLTGIVFLITILAACRSGGGDNQNDAKIFAKDSIVEVFLKDTLMRRSMHLFMSDSRKPDCGVIDNLQTEVFPGDTVIFKKGKNSRVETVDTIYLVDPKEKVFNIVGIREKVFYVLVIDTLTPTDTIVKYVIEFTVKDYDDTTFIIDPYLRIPPSP